MRGFVFKNRMGGVCGKLKLSGNGTTLTFEIRSGDREFIKTVFYVLEEYVKELRYRIFNLYENSGGGKNKITFSPSGTISRYYSSKKRNESKKRKGEKE